MMPCFALAQWNLSFKLHGSSPTWPMGQSAHSAQRTYFQLRKCSGRSICSSAWSCFVACASASAASASLLTASLRRHRARSGRSLKRSCGLACSWPLCWLKFICVQRTLCKEGRLSYAVIVFDNLCGRLLAKSSPLSKLMISQPSCLLHALQHMLGSEDARLGYTLSDESMPSSTARTLIGMQTVRLCGHSSLLHTFCP